MTRTLLHCVTLALMLADTSANAQVLPVTTTSRDARAHFEMGRNAAHHYQFAEARDHLDAAIAADSTFVLALLHRGGSAAVQAELESYLSRAKQHRDRASKSEQQMIDAFHAFLLEQNYQRAVEIFSQLAEEYPDDPYLPAYIGFRYYRNLKQYDKAAEQFERALARDSNFVQAYNWLGNIAMDQGDYATAQSNFGRYLRLAPDQPRPYNSLGVLSLRRGEYEPAARWFEQALARDARFTESRDNLVRVRIAQTNLRFEAAFARKDATALAALYTGDGQLLPAGTAAVEGREAITRYWQGAFDAGLTRADLETVEVYVGAYGDIATEVGRYRLAAGDQDADAGKYIVVWQKTPNGWQLHRDIWTTDRAPSR